MPTLGACTLSSRASLKGNRCGERVSTESRDSKHKLGSRTVVLSLNINANTGDKR